MIIIFHVFYLSAGLYTFCIIYSKVARDVDEIKE